jgi:EAL domain-containing protein (putative c-di-GMP-specific phosphodiesterase class I)
MLGEGGRLPPRAQFVRRADRRAVMRAIAVPANLGRPKMTPLKLEELEEALSAARLHTRYQPIVRLSDRKPVGLEVLARLDHPVHGTLSPEHFIPQMESAGLSRRLTEGVIARAFEDHAAHLASLDLWLALNFPLDVLMDEPALTWLEDQRQATGLPASKVIVELTESRPVAELDEDGLTVLRRSISRLRGLGYGLSIDDVGPEMKNHKALFGLNFTSAKLDRGLVAQAGVDPVARSFLDETIATAKQAGFSVVAEGVSDQETWDRMLLAGADQAQGYLVARPLPAAAVPVWMEAWSARRA